MNNILLAAPISEYKNYVLPQWLNHLCTLQGDFDILLVDNSKNPDYTETLKQYSVIQQLNNSTILRVDPENKTAQQFILESRQAIRDYFLKGNYTHLFSLECDVFCPADTIPRLLGHNLPIVSGWYFVGQGAASYPLFVNANILPGAKVFNIFVCGFIESFLTITGRLMPTIGNGIGCSLIKRDVIQKIPFRININDVGFDDSFFNQDLWLKGIQHFCDTSLFCDHKNLDWTKIKEYKEIDKTTGTIKPLKQLQQKAPKMQKQQIKAAIDECKQIIKKHQAEKIRLEQIITFNNGQVNGQTKEQKILTDHNNFEIQREIWKLQVDIHNKQNCIEMYQKRLEK